MQDVGVIYVTPFIQRGFDVHFPRVGRSTRTAKPQRFQPQASPVCALRSCLQHSQLSSSQDVHFSKERFSEDCCTQVSLFWLPDSCCSLFAESQSSLEKTKFGVLRGGASVSEVKNFVESCDFGRVLAVQSETNMEPSKEGSRGPRAPEDLARFSLVFVFPSPEEKPDKTWICFFSFMFDSCRDIQAKNWPGGRGPVEH